MKASEARLGVDREEPLFKRPLRQAVVSASRPEAWEKVGGISLTARVFYHLCKLGIEEVILMLCTDSAPESLAEWQGAMKVRTLKMNPGTDLTAPVLLAVSGLGPRLLYVDSTHLMDPRIIEGLAAATETTLAFIDRADRQKGTIRAGALQVEDIRVWAELGGAALVQMAEPLFPEDMEPFLPEIRGPLTPYFLEIRSPDDTPGATRLLIRSKQKHVMDLPAELIDPHFEDPLTFWLCQTPVTPNMVTFLGVAVASLVAWFFWHGHFLAGALLMFPVEVLDGVDGKLARTKLHYTKLGQHEDVIDYFYETSWYVALGVGLTPLAGAREAGLLACLLIVSDTLDNIFYTLAGKWHGKSIDLFSPLDGAFRRIGGRRNIYGAMFVIGFLLGYPLGTFAAVSVWAAVTATVHGVRLALFTRARKLPAPHRADA